MARRSSLAFFSFSRPPILGVESNWAALMLMVRIRVAAIVEWEARKKGFFFISEKGCWCFCYFLALEAMCALCVHSQSYTHISRPIERGRPPSSPNISRAQHNIQHHKSDPLLAWRERERVREKDSREEGRVGRMKKPRHTWKASQRKKLKAL